MRQNIEKRSHYISVLIYNKRLERTAVFFSEYHGALIMQDAELVTEHYSAQFYDTYVYSAIIRTAHTAGIVVLIIILVVHSNSSMYNSNSRNNKIHDPVICRHCFYREGLVTNIKSSQY